MKKISVDSRLVIKITPEEKKIARESKKHLKFIMRELEDAVDVISDLRDAILEERPSKDDLVKKYKDSLIRYREKIKKRFNSFLIDLKHALEVLLTINDPEMLKLRNIITSEVNEMSDGVEAILELLKEIKRERFTQKLEYASAQIEKRKRSIDDIIDNQLIPHIDKDILGKTKLGGIRLNIIKRSRKLINILSGE